MNPEELVASLPDGVVVTDPALFARYAADVTGRFAGTPAAVLRPANVDDVAAVLRLCNERRIGLVPQGGNTGLVGGAIPASDQVILSLERLQHVGPVDPAARTLVALGGATLEAVQAAAGVESLEFPIDFAARSSATIGGMIATDAGGALVMRHGTMRDLVTGMQAVLADGSIVDHLERPAKDSSGFDLMRLLPGSEGTLGIVTAAKLKLVTRPANRTVALIGLRSLGDAVQVASALRVVHAVEAIDFFLDAGLDLVMRHTGSPQPLPQRWAIYLVVSAANDDDPGAELADALSGRSDVGDVAVAQSPQQRTKLWSYRELHNEAINAAGVPHKLDVAVATERVPELVERVARWLEAQRPSTRLISYGHLADGNVHLNVLDADPSDDGLDEGILQIVADMNGSISAEHGIGQAKNRWLHLTRSPDEIAAMRAVKDALDPNGILNPGKLLPS